MLAANVYFIQASGRSGLLQFLELRVCTKRLLLELLQVNINGVTFRLYDWDGQVATVPGQAHAPSGTSQVQLAVIKLLQFEVHHVS